ncbi:MULTISPECIES: hypothetical protein [unclassified Bradyrhizobium]
MTLGITDAWSGSGDALARQPIVAPRREARFAIFLKCPFHLLCLRTYICLILLYFLFQRNSIAFRRLRSYWAGDAARLNDVRLCPDCGSPSTVNLYGLRDDAAALSP